MKNENIPGRPRAAKSAARRQRLLDTARNLFMERGFHQTGVAQIAAGSGIAVGQIYRDFANKEAIISAICHTQIAIWLEEEKLQAAISADDHAAVYAWVERLAFVEPMAPDRALMCELLAEIARNPAMAKVNASSDARLRSSIGTALDAIAPLSPAKRKQTIIDMIVTISWGMVALRELSPMSDHIELRSCMIKVLRKELVALDESR